MHFDTFSNAEYIMSCNNMAVGLNLPPAIKSQGEGDKEISHGLPPNAPRKAFLVDEYPACPENWMRSSGRVKSYFVPVVSERGLWLDFNQCLARVAQHVAIVVSAQGVNAVSGLPCVDPQLEQYVDTCPKHKEAFGPDRLCKKCGYKWPKQNYLSSTGTPHGMLWIDGFRMDDGTTRQYVFTENEMRSVAKAIIGKDRVFAFGISYFLSKTERPKPQMLERRYLADTGGMKGLIKPCSGMKSSFFMPENDIVYGASASLMSASTSSTDMALYDGTLEKSVNTKKSAAQTTPWSKGITRSASEKPLAPMEMTAVRVKRLEKVKQLEIAAGARISQVIYDDPNGLDFWQTEPTAMIVVNYCTEEDAERIINAGRVDLSGNREGFLQQVPQLGNP